jgi:hypothetical protein
MIGENELYRMKVTAIISKKYLNVLKIKKKE